MLRKILNFDKENFRIILLVIVQFFNVSEAWFENCDYQVNVRANSSLYINSPYYPNRYPPGSSCRYRITAPLDYEINIQCNIEIDKTSQECTSDYFYVSVDGDDQLRGSEYFCGDGYIQRKSEYNKLVIAYTSSTKQNAGRFSCYVQAQPQPCDCGWTQQARITGGTETKVNEFPSMAGVLYMPSNQVYCGASIISHNYAVSAAHCFATYRNPSDLALVVGDHDLRTSAETPYTQVIRVSSLKIHEQYTGNNGDYNDIALLKTVAPIQYSRGVGPICLPWLYSYSTFAGMSCDLVGWGTTQFAGSPSAVLRKATVRIITNDQCRPYFPNLISSQMCTYNPPKDSCQQDSGGPCIVKLNRMQLGGIISYGVACGTSTPSVNTRITSFLNWIQANTYGESFCKKT